MTRPRTTKALAHVGPYDLVEKVGSGGMGSVYRARDTRDGRIVALKLMHEHVASDPSYAERFRREAAMSALIDSPNVVRVLEFASDGGRPYIVTEFVEGPGVDVVLKQGPMAPEHAAAIAVGVANALAEAHRRSIVHRDIKPANILLGADGTPKVTDFGIATLNHASSLTVPGMFIGTAAYAAPEQHRGETDIRSDIYSLGVVLFEMLTGSLPFQAETATGMMRKHEEAPVPLERLAGAPPACSAVVARCLEKAPSRRFQHPSEVAIALGAALPVAASPASVAPEATVVPVAAAAPFAPNATEFAVPWAGAAATRVDEDLLVTGEHPMPLAPLAVLQAKVSETPIVRKALIAGVAVACVTALAMFGFRGSSADEPGTAGSGPGISGPVILAGETATPAPGFTVPTTPSTTVTTTPRDKTLPTSTATPTSTSTPSPSPAPKTVTPPPPPPPAPALQVADFAFCHSAACAYGGEDLYAGYPIGVAFQLSQVTYLPVSMEVWFDGEYYYTSNFTASSNGMYFDVIPYLEWGGELELDIYVGGQYLTTLWADVYDY